MTTDQGEGFGCFDIMCRSGAADAQGAPCVLMRINSSRSTALVTSVSVTISVRRPSSKTRIRCETPSWNDQDFDLGGHFPPHPWLVEGMTVRHDWDHVQCASAHARGWPTVDPTRHNAGCRERAWECLRQSRRSLRTPVNVLRPRFGACDRGRRLLVLSSPGGPDQRGAPRSRRLPRRAVVRRVRSRRVQGLTPLRYEVPEGLRASAGRHLHPRRNLDSS